MATNENTNNVTDDGTFVRTPIVEVPARPPHMLILPGDIKADMINNRSERPLPDGPCTCKWYEYVRDGCDHQFETVKYACGLTGQLGNDVGQNRKFCGKNPGITPVREVFVKSYACHFKGCRIKTTVAVPQQ